MEWRAQSWRETLTTCMDDVRHAHNLNLEPGDVVCRSWRPEPDLLDYAHMGSRVHQFTCWGSCALCGRCSGSWWSRCHWCRASCRSVSPRIRNTKCRVLSFWILQPNCALVVRLYSVIVNFSCNQILAHFYIAKTGHLRCCLYTPRRLQWTAFSCKRSICNKMDRILESHLRRSSPKYWQ